MVYFEDPEMQDVEETLGCDARCRAWHFQSDEAHLLWHIVLSLRTMETQSGTKEKSNHG